MRQRRGSPDLGLPVLIWDYLKYPKMGYLLVSEVVPIPHRGVPIWAVPFRYRHRT
jgi:hypothetical protein